MWTAAAPLPSPAPAPTLAPAPSPLDTPSQFGANLASADQDSLQRLAGNCELRSVVMCSHGNKDGREVSPMTTDHPSTMRIASVAGALDQMAIGGAH